MHLDGPELTVALALVLGVLGQIVGRHLRLPGIVVLLGIGVACGPDALDLVHPDTLGSSLQLLVSFAVAIILFEGALSLNFRQLRSEARSIRRLVSLGAMVTATLGTLIARYVLGWDWRPSVLFGTLIIVTGPTVINPLLRRVRIERKVATVLEAEGVFGDALGAILAVVALQVSLEPTTSSFARGWLELLLRFGVGALVGAASGLVLVQALRREGWIPRGLENVFTLTLVLLTFQGANALRAESGIVAVIAAGLLVGNLRGELLQDLREFKEQLTVMFIGLLFVLLAADVRLAQVRALGWPGLVAVALLVLAVRPLAVLVALWGTEHGWRQRAFIGWIGPRGIVAAAVASLFALRLQEAGMPGGQELRAMIFLLIAATVLHAGLTGGLVARLLRVRPKPPSGFAILGVNALSLAFAEACREGGQEVVFIDTNPAACHQAEEAGYRVLYGSGLDDKVLRRAHLEDRGYAVGLTANEGVNYAFGRRARREGRVQSVWVAVRRGRHGVTPEMVEAMGCHVLFGLSSDLALWMRRLERSQAEVARFVVEAKTQSFDALVELARSAQALLPLMGLRKGKTLMLSSQQELQRGDVLLLVVKDREEASKLLGELELEPLVEAREIAGSRSAATGYEAPTDPGTIPAT